MILLTENLRKPNLCIMLEFVQKKQTKLTFLTSSARDLEFIVINCCNGEQMKIVTLLEFHENEKKIEKKNNNVHLIKE